MYTDGNVEVKPFLNMDKFNNTVVTLDCQEVPCFFAGAKETQFPWSKCRWRTKRPGFSLHQGVLNEKKNNPRKTGEWLFTYPPTYHFKYVATDYVQCTSCKNSCTIALKLVYKPDRTVEIKSKTTLLQHGSKEHKELRTEDDIRCQIIKLRDSTTPPMKPMQIFINLAPIYSNRMPSLSQISEIVKYEDRKAKRLINLSEFLEHENIIHYEENKNYFIIIIKSNPTAFQLFGKIVSDHTKTVGLAAQYKNNSERFPLWILCTQNEGYRTIPGFVIMSNIGTATILTRAILVITNYLKEQGFSYSAITMIDKDEVERQALVNNGIQVYLCEFHLMKLLKNNFKCFGVNFDVAVEKFKMIQRSSTLSQMKINATLFKAFCLEQGQEKLWKLIKREYLSVEWLSTWCDFKRIGLRQGLYNTNNTSEAWFKSLLRVYLGGHSYSYLKVIDIIIHKVFVVTDIRLGQSGPTKLNPSLKSIKKLKKLAEEIGR